MITWRARTHKPCEAASSAAYLANQAKPGTRRSPGPAAISSIERAFTRGVRVAEYGDTAAKVGNWDRVLGAVARWARAAADEPAAESERKTQSATDGGDADDSATHITPLGARP
jgi:hypothetical protein